MMIHVVGLGPGDPDYVTVKAIETLRSSDVIFVPGSSSDRSISRRLISDLAARHGFPVHQEIIDLEFPMTRDRDLNQRAWRSNVSRIADAVSSGKKVSYAVLGNPTFYSTFSNILDSIRGMGIEIRFVAGVSSLDACSSVAGMNLAKGDESIAILTYSDFLRRESLDFDTVIVIKVPTGSSAIREARNRFPGFSASVYARRCTMPDQLIAESPGDDAGDYFSMLILRRN